MRDTAEDESDDRIDPDSNSGCAGDVDVSGPCSDPLLMGSRFITCMLWLKEMSPSMGRQNLDIGMFLSVSLAQLIYINNI